ncbi:hypothetical protein [Sediminicoccus sp. KRV36]|nr:hypothetical protein [Sediminicoccus rosea]UPY36673.1 hypothetical protein LHU95_20995 [Sediminicoccus rosea]
MSRNSIIALVGILGVVLGVGGYWLYMDQNRSGVELNVGGRGITIETR